MNKRTGSVNHSSKSHSDSRNLKYFSLDPAVEEIIKRSLYNSNYLYGEEKTSNAADDKQLIKNKYNHIRDSEFKRSFLNVISGSIQEKLAKSVSINKKLVSNELIDEKLKDEQKLRESSDDYIKIMNFRKKLPSSQKKEEILDIINSHQVVVISGETGK